MGRPRSLDRESLLDAAETVVAADGLAGLTFGAVALASGVPKASVQSVFGTRDAMIAAVLDRWLAQEQARFESLVGCDRSCRGRTRAHVMSTAGESPASGARMATLLAALASSGKVNGSGTAPWYAARAGDFKVNTEEERRLRVAFLAAEGAFYVRHLAGVKLTDARWRDIFGDILALVENSGGPSTDERSKKRLTR